MFEEAVQDQCHVFGSHEAGSGVIQSNRAVTAGLALRITSEVRPYYATPVGSAMVKDINTEWVQDVVASWKGTCSAKTIRNRIATFRLIWDKAKTWNYVAHTPYEGLDLPNYVRTEQPSFKPEDVTRIIAASESPYNVVWALTAECGIRRGEIAGLNVGDVFLSESVIEVRRSVTKKRQLKSPKNGKPRVFPISSKLVDRLRPLIEGRTPDAPLFLTAMGKRLEPDNFVKRHLTPLLRKLGLAGACHGFRHGNASALDHLRAPMRVRQDRLGHHDPETTMLYTHTVSEDERTVAEQLGELFAGASLPKFCLNEQTAQEPKSQAVA